ncbi:flagellin [Tepidanaerobacter sp. GT38]|uniref:flagellin N-terminal helical domain-containing protein n=1 Tax=Tepidanaerobacter sp. GT38 TaxID=2722793 RepID=UPI00272B603C|nr:flagellin [Tepidanaerobacter sp. GT38]MCG1011184.1 flagellin [Tepidanaerobacter sp. GT38]
MRINHNIMALNAHRQLSINNTNTQKSLEKLSSGYRINRAGDDAAGLAISEKMRAQIRGLNMASKNAQDGISLIQTAEGALNEAHEILQRMRELAVQSANDTNVGTDRQALQDEVNQLAEELTRIAENTEFNTQKLLNGDFSGKFHIGANKDQSIDLSIKAMDAETLDVAEKAEVTVSASAIDDSTTDPTPVNAGETYDIVEFDTVAVTDGSSNTINAQYGWMNKDGEIVAISADGKDFNALSSAATIENLASATYTSVTFALGAEFKTGTVEISEVVDTNVTVTARRGIYIADQESANSAITKINDALEKVSTERSKLGAVQNRLEHTIKNLDTSAENLQAAESRIRDVDMAKEMMEFTKQNILQQAATAMLAQANMAPQTVLKLLG